MAQESSASVNGGLRTGGRLPAQSRALARLYTHCVAHLVEGKLDLVPGDDPEPITEVLGDHDLALRPHSLSHTW
jgi:hypothetical protein